MMRKLWILAISLLFIVVACDENITFARVVDLPDARVDTLIIYDSTVVIDSIPMPFDRWHFDTTITFHVDTLIIFKRLPPGVWCAPEEGKPYRAKPAKYDLWDCRRDH